MSSPFYKDSLVTIYHVDCREILNDLPRGLIVTDPPYNVGYHYENYSDKMDGDEYLELLMATCLQPCVVIHYPEFICEMSLMFDKSPDKMVAWIYPSNTMRQWRGIGWWGAKPDFYRDGQDYRNPTDPRIEERIAKGQMARLYDWWEVNQVKNVGEEKTDHPCQIPISVMRRILKITECQLVIDPFCGSGSTLVAAKQLGIPSIGIEMDRAYCEISANRVIGELNFHTNHEIKRQSS